MRSSAQTRRGARDSAFLMSLPNLSGLAHAPPCPTGRVLTVEDVEDHPDQRSFATPDVDEDENPVLLCNIMGERFFESDDPKELVVAIELDNCKHVFHGSYLCTKVFGAERSAGFEDGVQGLWDSRTNDWRNKPPPLCDFCRKPFAFSNIRELVEKVEACNVKNILGDAYPRACLLYTSPSPRDATLSRMPSSA